METGHHESRRDTAKRRFGELLLGTSSQIVTQVELLAVLRERENVQALRKRLGEAESLLAAKEALVIQKLKAGARTTGRLRAAIETLAGSIRPQWKERFLLHMEREHGVPRGLVEAHIRQDTKVPRKERLAISEGPLILATATNGSIAGASSP